jgi:hypothetical protein
MRNIYEILAVKPRSVRSLGKPAPGHKHNIETIKKGKVGPVLK